MKKYTQPTVEITAFDFEDITMSTLGGGNSINANNTSAQQSFNNDVMQDSAKTVVIPW